MGKIYLDLNYGTVTLFNLKKTWIQAQTMSPGFMLCYEDDKYKRGIIYRSTNKRLLINVQEKIMDEINSGKVRIRCTTNTH